MKTVVILITLAVFMIPLYSCSGKSDSSKEKDVDYTSLDSTWECDYLKLSTNSNWEVKDNFENDSASVEFSWMENDHRYSINCYFFHNDNFEKLTVSESEERWKELQKSVKEDSDDYLKDAYIKDSFVKNGQAYLVTGGGPISDYEIEFYGNKLHGTLHFYPSDDKDLEQTVLNIIDSMTFYEE